MKQITIFLEGESPTLKLIMGKQQQHHKHIFIFEYFHIYVCRNFTRLYLCAFITNINTFREVSKYGVISRSYFPAFGLNAEIYGP